jgi:hypothetical protein
VHACATDSRRVTELPAGAPRFRDERNIYRLCHASIGRAARFAALRLLACDLLCMHECQQRRLLSMTVQEPGCRSMGRVESLMRAKPAIRSADAACLTHTAERIARLLQYDYGRARSPVPDARQHVYFVPDHTLTAVEAERLGVRSERDLFGGVVPHAFVATRAATHAPVSADAEVPQSWSYALARILTGCVLRGYSAFSREDARMAARRLLRSGPVRLNCGETEASCDMLCDMDEFDEALGGIAVIEIATQGVVVEQALSDQTTYVVGRARVGNESVSIVGTRRAARIESGRATHAGSDLAVVPGDFTALECVGLSAEAREAVIKAARYDEAISHAYRSSFASRRSYDVVLGHDRHGTPRMGVRGPSWRVAAESPAEIAALAAFRDVPGLRCLRAATCEAVGRVDVPPDAMVYYRSSDADDVVLTKYCTIDVQAY